MAKKKRSNAWIWLLGVVALVLIVLAGVGSRLGWFGKQDGIKVAVEQSEKRTIVELVTARGKIYPEAEVKLSPDVSGEVIELMIQEGDSVKTGQHLATINPEIYYSMIDRAEAAVNSAKSSESNSRARISQLSTQVDKAKRDFERNRTLLEQKVISQLEFEGTEAAYLNLQGEMDAAQETLKGAGFSVQSAAANLKEAKENLRKTKIYAPIGGVVSKLNIEKGERVVGTSQFQGTEIIRIASFDNMEARVDVSENDVLKVTEGDTAVVEVDAYLERTFKGVVYHVANSATDEMLSTDQSTNFMVKIRLLKESYADLIKESNGKRIPFNPGMSASADIETRKIRDVISVPIQSVTARAPEDSLDTNDEEMRELVFIIDGEKAYEREVKTGIQDDTYIQITDGLEVGQDVVVAPYRAITKRLEDEKKVNVVERKELFKNKDED